MTMIRPSPCVRVPVSFDRELRCRFDGVDSDVTASWRNVWQHERFVHHTAAHDTAAHDADSSKSWRYTRLYGWHDKFDFDHGLHVRAEFNTCNR